MDEVDEGKKGLTILPGAKTVFTALPMLDELDIQGYTDGVAGWFWGSIIASLYVAGLSSEEIKAAIAEKIPKGKEQKGLDEKDINDILEGKTGIANMTLAEAEAQTGKKLIILCMAQDVDGKDVPLRLTADEFPDLTVAEACKASCSGIYGIDRHELTYEGQTYSLRSSWFGDAKDAIPFDEYDKSALLSSNWKFGPFVSHHHTANMTAIADRVTDKIYTPVSAFRGAGGSIGGEQIQEYYKKGDQYWRTNYRKEVIEDEDRTTGEELEVISHERFTQELNDHIPEDPTQAALREMLAAQQEKNDPDLVNDEIGGNTK